MSDWQVGDLAVCVDDSPLSSCAWGTLRVGHTGRVLKITLKGYGMSLLIEGARSGHWSGQYRSCHFRKIRPDERESCEPEFVTLLKRLRSPARVE